MFVFVERSFIKRLFHKWIYLLTFLDVCKIQQNESNDLGYLFAFKLYKFEDKFHINVSVYV